MTPSQSIGLPDQRHVVLPADRHVGGQSFQHFGRIGATGDRLDEPAVEDGVLKGGGGDVLGCLGGGGGVVEAQDDAKVALTQPAQAVQRQPVRQQDMVHRPCRRADIAQAGGMKPLEMRQPGQRTTAR